MKRIRMLRPDPQNGKFKLKKIRPPKAPHNTSSYLIDFRSDCFEEDEYTYGTMKGIIFNTLDSSTDDSSSN